jgi:8-oxo-dGTP pyrophosphatase MutT (NUDIX family)
MTTAPEARRRLTVPVAVHLFLVRDDEILLLRRFNTGYEDGNYSVVAGHLDGEETVLIAMAREAREEAGIDLVNAEIAGAMHRRAEDGERIDFFIACSEWTGEIRNLEPEKCDEIRWVPIGLLPPNTIPYVAAAIDAWRAGRWFSSFGWDG